VLSELSDEELDEVAMGIYADSYTQYGTCSPRHWQEVSEVQREFCRGQARVAVAVHLAILGRRGR